MGSVAAHIFDRGDTVERELVAGVVVRGGTLHVEIRWDDGTTEEVEQGDPSIRRTGCGWVEDGDEWDPF